MRRTTPVRASGRDRGRIRAGSVLWVEAELAAWITDQAWITGDGPKAIFEGAVAWCRAWRVLLPGVTTLEELVAAGQEAAEQRLWAQLAGQLSPSAAGVLLGLLEGGPGGHEAAVQ